MSFDLIAPESELTKEGAVMHEEYDPDFGDELGSIETLRPGRAQRGKPDPNLQQWTQPPVGGEPVGAPSDAVALRAPDAATTYANEVAVAADRVRKAIIAAVDRNRAKGFVGSLRYPLVSSVPSSTFWGRLRGKTEWVTQTVYIWNTGIRLLWLDDDGRLVDRGLGESITTVSQLADRWYMELSMLNELAEAIDKMFR